MALPCHQRHWQRRPCYHPKSKGIKPCQSKHGKFTNYRRRTHTAALFYPIDGHASVGATQRDSQHNRRRFARHFPTTQGGTFPTENGDRSISISIAIDGLAYWSRMQSPGVVVYVCVAAVRGRLDLDIRICISCMVHSTLDSVDLRRYYELYLIMTLFMDRL